MKPIKHLNQTFARKEHGDTITVFRVDTKGKDQTGKIVTLSRPVYHIKYNEIQKDPFTTYVEEIDRMVAFERWIIKN